MSDLVSHDLPSVVVRSRTASREIVVGVHDAIVAGVALVVLGEGRPSGIAARSSADGIDIQDLGIDDVILTLEGEIATVVDIEAVESGVICGDANGSLPKSKAKTDRGVNLIYDIESLSDNPVSVKN